jgi:hypothetical protein
MNYRPRLLDRRFVNALLAGAVAWPVSATVPLLVSKQHDLQESLQHLLLSIFVNFRSGCAYGATAFEQNYRASLVRC